MRESKSTDSVGNDTHMCFYYTNWKGNKGIRKISGDPVFWYGSTKYHTDDQWFIRAYDIEKKAIRDFAVLDILKFIKEM